MGGVYVVKGSDPILRDRELSRLLDELVGDDDRTLVVEEYRVPAKAAAGADDDAPTEDVAGAAPIVTAVVNAAQSPPFMTAKRIVVVRDYEALPADSVAPMVTVLADLLDTTEIIFVAGAGGRIVKVLADALKSANVRGGGAEKTIDLLQGELDRAGLTMQADAARVVVDHLGEDAGRLGALADLWSSTFDPGSRLELGDVTPYLNDAGSVKPFQLNNRIEEGDVAGALEILHRLLTVTSPVQPKPMHPLQVLGILTGRYRKLARLDSDDVRTVDDAHRVWGGKGSTFPAKKGLEAARGLGAAGFVRAFAELHRADVGIKGASGLPAETLLEIAVARLASLHRGRRWPGTAGRRHFSALAGHASSARFAAFMRREVRRAAWFLWTMPLDDALPNRRCACLSASPVCSSPAAAALRGGLEPRLELGSHREVPYATDLVLAIPLLLADDVGHGAKDLPKMFVEPGNVSSTPERRLVRSCSPPTDENGPVSDLSRYRNLSIVAHIDHGKSTLADRFLEITGAVQARDMRAQYLDSMDIERERGITIKAQNVRIAWRDHIVNLIDTPGHVDFGYEVSRSLAACEGVVLVVDASQGIEAQTLANCYLALEHDLAIVAAVNKIDLPAADPDRVSEEIERVLGVPAEEILRISAKTGEGVSELLDAIVERIPPPVGEVDEPLQALIFDSHYDTYRGVISSVRVFNGSLDTGAKLRFIQAASTHDAEEVGTRLPVPTPVASLGPGEVGYLITGLKDVGQARVGETVTTALRPSEPLAGYLEPKPMVFCGLYPVEGDEYANLREALEKLRLNDSSFTYEPETSGALGFGFRCGFLGLLHMEIVRERLEREYDLDLVATAPNVEYRAVTTSGTVEVVDNPSSLPPPNDIAGIEEPYVTITILTPTEFVGTLMELSQQRRGEMQKLEYLSEERVELVYTIPLAEIVMDYFDQLKSRSKGYASLDYEPAGYRESKLVKVDIMLNGTPVDAFSSIAHRDKAYDYGKRMTEKLRELIPRQLFDVPIQAAISGRVIARETVKAKRKDVIAKCYGGDITRKRKLLEKQKAGKKRMKQIGSVEVPQEAFVAALKLSE